jgi:hypothetical protein
MSGPGRNHHPSGLPTLALRVAIVLSVTAALPVAAQVSPGPLSKAHADLEGTTKCLSCHASGSSSIDERCRECHLEIDFQIRNGKGLHGQEAKTDCVGCHPDHAGRGFELINWKEGKPDRFDHRRAGWSLEGKHASLRCEQCHQSEFQKGSVMQLLKRRSATQSWLGLERACLSCHRDNHQGTLKGDCLSCHVASGWKPASRFEHAKTTFPLIGKHAETPCAKCHLVPGRVELRNERGEAVPRYKPVAFDECSACHKDVHAGQLGPRCSTCHVSDGYKIVERGKFDHSKTRYPLNGKHRAVECAQCHDPQRAWGKKPRYDTCDACHRDPHAGTATLAGQVVDCARCHDLNGFEPSTYTVAQHRETTYPLEGKHQTVTCDRCHRKEPPGTPSAFLGEARVLIRPAYAQCRDCHRDLHGSQLARRADQGACEACHRVEGWKPSTFTVEHHAETEFALAGRHTEIECAACHGPERRDLPPLPGPETLGEARVALTTVDQACRTCHHDPHDSRFEPQGARPIDEGCRGCHGERAFVPSRVDAEVHGRLAYPLQGAHRLVPCVLCHEELKKGPATVRLLRVDGPSRPLAFEAKHERCDTCHTSPHHDQFSHREDRGECGGCHLADGWRPAGRFDHERDTEFLLQGAHQKVACERCHGMTLDSEGRPFVVYRPLKKECRDCHGLERWAATVGLR